MKKNLKTIIITLACTLGVTILNAQGIMKHELRPFYSTSYAAGEGEMFAETLVNGIFGFEKTEATTFGMGGLGYRYNMDRFSIGIDLGFSSAKKEVFKRKEDTKAVETTKIKRYFVMPTVSYSYYKNDLINLYGAASVGAVLETSKLDQKDAKAVNEKNFAYQVNPIGLRIGSETIGAFIELGYGHKGIVTAGLSFKF